jgi:glucose-1-phosphate thymidylyltransferase
LAAGRGERLQPLTNEIPKALVNTAGKPLLRWALEHLQSAGVSEVVVAVGWKGAMIQRYVESEHFANVRVVEVSDYSKGPLHTLVGALESTRVQDLLVAPVDAWLSVPDLQGLVESPSCDLVLATDYSRDTGTPVYSMNRSNLVGLDQNLGTSSEQGSSAMVFRAGDLFAETAVSCKEEGHHRVLSVINRMVSDGMNLLTYSVKDAWFDLDTVGQLLENNRHILTEGKETLNGTLIPAGDVIECGDVIQIAPQTTAERGVVLEGPVLLGHGCQVGEGSKIGPNTSLGGNTVVGAACRIQNSILFGTSAIGANTSITDSLVFKSTVHGG